MFNTVKNILSNPTDDLIIVQFNANHCETAMDLLIENFRHVKNIILAIQDPYLYKGQIPYKHKNLQIYQSLSNNCCILIPAHNFKHVLCHKTSSSVGIILTLCYKNILLINTNCQPRDPILPFLTELDGYNYQDTILLGDMNARSQIWGYKFQDFRGKSLIEFALSKNLNLCNDPTQGPTFSSQNGIGYPDVTFLTGNIFQYLNSWNVAKDNTMSDHQYIITKLSLKNFSYANSWYYNTKYALGKFMFNFQQITTKFKIPLQNLTDIQTTDKTFNNLYEQIKSLAE